MGPKPSMGWPSPSITRPSSTRPAGTVSTPARAAIRSPGGCRRCRRAAPTAAAIAETNHLQRQAFPHGCFELHRFARRCPPVPSIQPAGRPALVT
jgi:hypothetical protein